MHRFKWRVPIATLAFLLTALALPTHAQSPIQCFVNAQPVTVRTTGLAELIGDITIVCTGGNPVAAGVQTPMLNVSVTLSANITTRLVATTPEGSLTEAILTLDEPQPGAQFPCIPAQGPTCPAFGNGTGAGVYANDGNPNLFRGVKQNDNTIVFLGVPLDPPGQSQQRTLRIKNIRAAVAGAAADNGQIFAFVSLQNPPANLQLNNASVAVGFVQSPLQVQYNNVLPIDRFVDRNDFRFAEVRFVERFGTAFMARTPSIPPEAPTPQDVLSASYGTETGFFAPGIFPAQPTLGLADNGTLLELRFDTVPAGLTLEVGAPTSTSQAFSTRPIDGAVPDADGHITVQLSGGSGVVRWEVTNASPFSIESVVVPVFESHSATNPPARGTLVMTARLGTVDTVNVASFTAPQPRFMDAPFTRQLPIPGGPPTARAGPDQVIVEGDVLILDGSASTDPDGDTLTYSWRIISPFVFDLGTGVQVSGQAAPTDEFGQDYVVELTVDDHAEGTSTDTLIIRVENDDGMCEGAAPPRCDANQEAYVYIAIETSAGTKFAACWTDFSVPTPVLDCALDASGALALTDGEPICLEEAE